MDTANLVHSFFNSAGPGGMVVLIVLVGAVGVYIYLTRWILEGGSDSEWIEGQETDPYKTS